MLEERDARIAVLEAANAKLREALRPFAKIRMSVGDSLWVDVGDAGVHHDGTNVTAADVRRAAAAYPTHSEGGEADKTGRADECGPRLHIAQPLSDQRSAAALRSQAEANVLAVRSWDSPGFPACVTREMEKIKAAIAKRHRDNHDTSPPCVAEPDLELSDVKAALETLGASPSKPDEGSGATLLACPFCGSPAYMDQLTIACSGEHGICCAVMYHKSDDQAMASWNRRAAASPSPSALTEEGVTERTARQLGVFQWCAAAFGSDHALSVEQRGLRLAEEAIEAAQAARCNPATLHSLIDYVYARPVGDLKQETGGVGLCILALAAAAGFDADTAEAAECKRVLSKPLDYFAARNRVKNDAGFVADAWKQPLASALSPKGGT